MSNLYVTEAWLLRILSALLRLRDGPFADVGVNTGQTLIKVKALDMKREYLGFEPNPLCVAYVKALIRANAFDDCLVVPMGLSDRSTVTTLLMTTEGSPDGHASLIEGFRDGTFYSAKQPVPVSRFDDLAGTLGFDALSIMKVDVEGGELEVLAGAKGALAQYRPFVLCEILPIYDENSDIGGFRRMRQVRMEKLLRGLGYSIARISHSDSAIHYLDRIDTHSNLNWCDYLFVPNEQRDDLDRELAQ